MSLKENVSFSSSSSPSTNRTKHRKGDRLVGANRSFTLSEERYTRNDEQNRLLNLVPPETQVHIACVVIVRSCLMLCVKGDSSDGDGDTGEGGRESEGAVGTDEPVSFPMLCSVCRSPSETRMKLIGTYSIVMPRTRNFSFFFAADIPFFKQVVVMATLCDVCGYRSNEVKSGAGISEKGIKISLCITDPSDLSRDVLKVSFEVLSR